MRFRDRISRFMLDMRDKTARFMYGRCGWDAFSRFLIIAAFIVAMIAAILSHVLPSIVYSILMLAAMAAIVYAYFRCLSRNTYKRSLENSAYMRKKTAVKTWFRSLKDRWTMRGEYKFFRCPSCRTLLRVPRGKGKIQLTCRKCGNRFERKS